MSPHISTLTAYPVGPTDGWSIEPASPKRDWMDKLHDGFPYRCLPLVIANQLGWIVRAPISAEATWSGGADPTHTHIDVHDTTPEHQRPMISSHFGGGIVTVSLPWLFRTSPGTALWVGGVPNRPVPGVAPLEGVIETEWAPYTFTMNLKLTDAGRVVYFDPGQPVCMIRPVTFAPLESMSLRYDDIRNNPELRQRFEQWRRQRLDFNADPERTPKDWQKNYYKGNMPDGSSAQTPSPHRTRLKLASFDGKGSDG